MGMFEKNKKHGITKTEAHKFNITKATGVSYLLLDLLVSKMYKIVILSLLMHATNIITVLINKNFCLIKNAVWRKPLNYTQD